MAVTIFWNKPKDATGVSTPQVTVDQYATYNIQIYRTTSTENSDYSLIDTVAAKVSGLDVTSYTDSTGQSSYFYYVVYINIATNAVTSRVLARIAMSVREQRLVEELYQQVPEVIRARFSNDPNYFVMRRAVNDALNTINFYPPLTAYTLDNLPQSYEPLINLSALAYVYIEQYLGVAIRDINFSGGIPSVSIDRGSKIKTAIDTTLEYLKQYTEKAKMQDVPYGIGLGSQAMFVPQGRIFSDLFNAGTGYL